jgi:hypothetical protein
MILKSIGRLLLPGKPWQGLPWIGEFFKACPWMAMQSQALWMPCDWSSIIAITLQHIAEHQNDGGIRRATQVLPAFGDALVLVAIHLTCTV